MGPPDSERTTVPSYEDVAQMAYTEAAILVRGASYCQS